ncbi:class I SAM-dependent methyltransferase [Polaribacter aestuariivivens]|uniref:Class I SAM-dependent methyltransferase n=1 Tax=Polaribacter aestuariivivens TaxID=2304626 RepID=A0A5S3N7J1_9FLAO|nr:class I SAM-dependent methyltransferase [Polaribacter aestuariivivens]TMM31280.1 class I SAM-dependent methyltransferase [Polaribacter aestuariivivens]
MSKKQLITKQLEDFYNKASEETRLDSGMGFFEFERIKSLIERHIKKPNSTIIDVGGGTGKYSEWLSEKDHKVHLIEPVEKHIKLAKKRADKLKNKFSVTLGESRNLPYENDIADLVILHGPLYHLQKKEDRLQTINEAKRVLKKGGIILGFAINSSASTVAGLMQGLIHKKPFLEMCKTELTSGIHNPPKEFPWLLADGFYHKPKQLKKEFTTQNLEIINLFAVEGMIWLDNEYFANMLNPKKKATLLELLKTTELDESVLAFSPHMMLVARK